MDEMVASAAFILICNLVENYKSPRRFWESAIYKNRNRSNLVLDMQSQQISGHFKNFTRMSCTDFEYLMNMIGPKIHTKDTKFRKAITVQDKLALTLRFLASGDSFTSLQYTFRISKQVISKFVPEVCIAIINALKDNVKIPNNSEEWKTVSEDFNDLWNFPHCVGAMDGKHVLLQAPFNSGAEFFNYKSTYSIVLFAMVDANYNIIFVDAGCQGRISDGGVFKNCKLHDMIENNDLNLPAPVPLHGRTKDLPYFILGDSAFALSENVMKPYPGQTHAKGSKERIFNYRLSRARRVVENVFGIMSSVFRVLRRPMLLDPDKATTVVMTIVHLHNFLRRPSSRRLYMPHHSVDTENEDGQLIEGTWRHDTDMTSFYPIRNVARRSQERVKEMRNELADYFMAEGRLSWQHNYA